MLPEPHPALVKLLLDNGADPNYVWVEQSEEPPFSIDEVKDIASEMGLDPDVLSDVCSDQVQDYAPVMRFAVSQGSVELVELLVNRGANLDFTEPGGYTAVLHSIYGHNENAEMLAYLIRKGLDLDVTTRYGESAIKVAYHLGRFKLVAMLLEAGASDQPLEWTPLMRATTVGGLQAVEMELARNPDLEAQDCWDRSALHLTLLKGDLELVQLLVSHGADLTAPGQGGSNSITYAVESGNRDLVSWLVTQGCSVEGMDPMGYTCLAQAAGRHDRPMVELLLTLGANPNAKTQYGHLLQGVTDREILLAFIRHGADPANLDAEGRRALVGLGDQNPDLLDAVTNAEFLAGRAPREGSSNPEEIKDPFKLAMIRAGVHAYAGRSHFPGAEVRMYCGAEDPALAVWCADRFGQSTTMLPGGGVVLIGGEHEDFYDADFCIYNDVMMFDPGGNFRLFGYPYSVFPPTDFHSATLVGKWIYNIIGALGYSKDQKRPLGTYRLDTSDVHIERIETANPPDRIYEHRGRLVGEHSIRIAGGKIVSFDGSHLRHDDNKDVFTLDLRNLKWSKE